MEENIVKFPFLSSAQCFSFMLDEPVSILFGSDHLYWVVPTARVDEVTGEGYYVYPLC